MVRIFSSKKVRELDFYVVFGSEKVFFFLLLIIILFSIDWLAISSELFY